MRKALFLVLVMVLAASGVYADEGESACKWCADLKSTDMKTFYGARIGNGLCNTVLGWSEIVFRPGKLVSAGENPVVAFVRSLGNAIARTGAGALELATFWTPGESVVTISDCPFCTFK